MAERLELTADRHVTPTCLNTTPKSSGRATESSPRAASASGRACLQEHCRPWMTCRTFHDGVPALQGQAWRLLHTCCMQSVAQVSKYSAPANRNGNKETAQSKQALTALTQLGSPSKGNEARKISACETPELQQGCCRKLRYGLGALEARLEVPNLCACLLSKPRKCTDTVFTSARCTAKSTSTIASRCRSCPVQQIKLTRLGHSSATSFDCTLPSLVADRAGTTRSFERHPMLTRKGIHERT